MAQDFELINQLEIEVEKQTGKKLDKYSQDDKLFFACPHFLSH